MKRALVVSLLRLGDIMMTSPLFKKLKNDGYEIDLLVNEQFFKAKELFPEINKIYGFPRKSLQEGVANTAVPIFSPFLKVNALAASLNKNEYDIVINATQNKVSAHFVSLLRTNEVCGFSYHEDRAIFHGSWSRYLNDFNGNLDTPIFHFSDIIKNLYKTQEKQNEGVPDSEQVLRSRHIIIQLLTSDQKKSWEIASYIQLVKKLNLALPNYLIEVIGAPNEHLQLDQFAELANKENLKFKISMPTLLQAKELLKTAKLLITGDTSIKHLAAMVNTPTLEISLGSSDAYFTGSYMDGAIIVQPKIDCFPCQHSENCKKTSFECHDLIPVNMVSALAISLTEGYRKDLKVIAEEFKDKVNVYETSLSMFSLYQLLPLTTIQKEYRVEQFISSLAWNFYLSGEHNEAVAEYGSLAVQLRDFLKTTPSRLLIERLKKIESHFFSKEMSASRILDQMRNGMTGNDLVEECFKKLSFNDQVTFKERGIVPQLTRLNFVDLRYIQNSLNRVKDINMVKSKICRTLKSQLMEMK